MTLYQKFKKMDIDFSLLGLSPREDESAYYCTPKGAQILGWAGVDGIHYCTIPEFGEMIFSVDPMDFGNCVHPIAQNFEDLLRLLLSCGSLDAPEQCYAWDEEQFNAFLIDYPVTPAQQTILDTLRREFDLQPMENAFSYIKDLQAGFDLSKIPYTEDFYDPDMNAAAPVRPAEWEVTYNGNFRHHEGNAGSEIPIGKTFYWGNEKWYVPAAYLCDEGLVIDYFMEVDPARVKAFIDKWDLYHEETHHYTQEQQEEIQRQHPLYVSFDSHAELNGQALQSDHGYGMVWLPDACQSDDGYRDIEAQGALEHYELNMDRAWAIHRCAYRCGKVSRSAIQSLTVRMERQRENISGQHFQTPAVGESISLTHPLTGSLFTLTVHEVEQQQLPERAFTDRSMEYPRHYLAISYSLTPDIPSRDLMIRDCAEGEHPQPKQPDPNEFAPVACSDAAVIGIIGGADGPTAIAVGQGASNLHAACSSLHFAAVDEVEWRLIASAKRMEDVTVTLLDPKHPV